MLTDTEYLDCDLTDLALLVAKKELNETELLATVNRRVKEVNPDVNAIVDTFDDPSPQDPAASPFRGVPFFIKELYAHVKGQVTTGACSALQHNVVDHDSEIVARYRKAGLRIIGRSNTCEFGTLGTCEPVLHGPTRNPWSLERSAGGSSGGAGALVAAGILPAAHGGDGAGSIRIPASCCGVFGLKPTRGRNSFAPDLGEGLSGIVVEHVLTKSVRDSAALLDATAGPAPGDPYSAQIPKESFQATVNCDPGSLRIGLVTRSMIGIDAHPDCANAAFNAANLLEELGHKVIEANLSIDADDFFPRYDRLWALAGTRGIYSAANAVGQKPEDVAARSERFNQFLFERGKRISAAQYLQDHAWFHSLSRSIVGKEAEFDLILSPTLGTPPPKLGYFDGRSVDGEQIMERFYRFLGFTLFANLTGQPSMSVPLNWNDDGLPIGVQLTAKTGEEGRLFSLARQLEKAKPWFGHRPTTSRLNADLYPKTNR